MTATVVHDRNGKAAEYLQLLRSMASEMERAMQAIAHNALPDLEESVASQQMMSARLLLLAGEISPPIKTAPAIASANLDAEMMQEVMVANDSLQKLNRRYAALLEHSSRSIARMASLFSGFQGQFQGQNFQGQTKEASGPRSKHQTWSCQM